MKRTLYYLISIGIAVALVPIGLVSMGLQAWEAWQWSQKR